MLDRCLGNGASPDSSSVLDMHLLWLQELTKRLLILSIPSPVSTAEGPGAQSKTHSPPCAISSASSLHFSLKSTCFSNLPACQDQLFQYCFLNSSLSCSVSDLPEIT